MKMNISFLLLENSEKLNQVYLRLNLVLGTSIIMTATFTIQLIWNVLSKEILMETSINSSKLINV